MVGLPIALGALREVAHRVWNRLAKLRARLAGESGDVVPGDAVQVIWGGPIGWVESAGETHAVVAWNNDPGHREIIELRHIKRASADPAFGPDVREIG